MKKIPFLKIFLISLLILSISFAATAKNTAVTSKWTNVPIKIDGSTYDWAGNSFTFEKKAQIDYAFRNDSDYVYILFIFKDPKYLSSIRASGMTIYFNTEGKNKQDHGITFLSKRIPADQFIALIEQDQGPMSEERKTQMLKTPYYNIQNYKIINEKSKSFSPDTESSEIKNAVFRIASQEKTVVYEFAIPLEKQSDLDPGIGTEAGKSIKIGFEWGGMTKEMREARMKQLGEQSTRTTATKAGEFTDERSGGRASSSSMASMRRRIPKKYSFWVDLQLAQK